MSNPPVAVLMSTYNGEKYLIEQINSILNQSYENIHLFIRDDGSTDDTRSILNQFMDNPKITVIQGTKNLGYRNSFFTLVQEAISNEKNFDYYAFSDQDDVWHTEKISSAIRMLEQHKNNSYRIYYTGLTFVDEQLNFLKIKDESKTKTSFGAEIVRHSISGATTVFSYDLGKLAVTNMEQLKISGGHDAFLFRLNAAIQGEFICDESNYIMFRRHNTNTSSATSGLIHKLKKEFMNSDNSEMDTAIFIQKYFPDMLDIETSEDIHVLINYRKSLFDKFKLLNNKRFRRENVIMNVLFLYRVIFNKI